MAIVERLPAHLGDIPAAEADYGLETQILDAEAWADELREMGQELLNPNTDAPAEGRGAALAKVEARLGEAETLVTELLERRVASSGPLIAARVSGLRDVLAAQPFDAAALNLALRRVFSSATIHAEHRILELHYIHGGECALGY